jgi:DNA-binding transcriptional MerR regulator
MRVSELSFRTGYSPDTLRFYEKTGLLPVERAGRGYKRYTEWHVVRLLQIKYAKAAGFTLAQIRELLDQWVSGQLSPAEKQAILTKQVQKNDQAMAELQVVRRYLQEKAEAEAAGQSASYALHLHHTL